MRIPVSRPVPGTPPDEVVAAFGIASVGSPLRPSGEDAENWTAERADGTRVVLRFERYGGRPFDAIIGWSRRLVASGVRSVEPLAAVDGVDVVRHASGDWTCWRRIDGEPVDPTVDAARSAGALLVDIHAVDPGGPGPEPWALRWLDALGERDPVAAQRLADLRGPARICHGDLHAANCLQVGGVLWAVDLMDAGVADPALDCAIAAAYWGASGGPAVAQAFLAGYSARRGVDVGCSPALVADAAALLLLRDGALGDPDAELLAEFLTVWDSERPA